MERMKRLVWEEKAAELVEFALAAGIFFTLMFGIIEFCLVVYVGSFVAFAAQQGSRYAMVRGSDWTGSCQATGSFGCQASAVNVQNYVLSLPHPAINLLASNVSVTWPGTTAAGASAGCSSNPYSQGCQVKVKVSYTFNLAIPVFPASIPLSSTAIETIQN